jgi:AraC-like DNA-binding protein
MEELFQCEIVFASQRSEAIFDRRVLDMHLPFGDAEAVESLSCMASAALQRRLQREQSVSERVRTALLSEYDQSSLDIEKVATLLHVNPRNLRRWLRREGTSWRAIVDDYRRERAVQFLRRGGTTIKEVSDTMGYSEPSAFHRAFRRWTGVAPAAYLRTASP